MLSRSRGCLGPVHRRLAVRDDLRRLLLGGSINRDRRLPASLHGMWAMRMPDTMGYSHSAP